MIPKEFVQFGINRLSWSVIVFYMFSLTDTQTHRHKDTQTHRHTDTQTQRHTDTRTQTQTQHVKSEGSYVTPGTGTGSGTLPEGCATSIGPALVKVSGCCQLLE